MALNILKGVEITYARKVINNVTPKPIIDNVISFPCHSWVDKDSEETDQIRKPNGEQGFPPACPILPNHCS